MQINKKEKAFTMIETMVAMFMIAILAGVVVTSVSYARGKARDARIIQGVNQLMQMAQADTMGNKNYVEWFSNPPGPNHMIMDNNDCEAAFPDVTAEDICKEIINDIGPGALAAGPLWAGPDYGNTGTVNKLSIMTWLPHTSKYYCLGSSGKSSQTTNNDGTGCVGGSWDCEGCFNNN